MPKEIFPSSYLCDCGYQCDFFEKPVLEIKRLSMRRRQRLLADDDQHRVVFEGGKMVDIICPNQNKKTENAASGTSP